MTWRAVTGRSRSPSSTKNPPVPDRRRPRAQAHVVAIGFLRLVLCEAFQIAVGGSRERGAKARTQCCPVCCDALFEKCVIIREEWSCCLLVLCKRRKNKTLLLNPNLLGDNPSRMSYLGFMS